MRGLKDSPLPHGEWLSAFAAFVEAAASGLSGHLANALGVGNCRNEGRSGRSAKARFDVRKCRVFVLEAVFGKDRNGPRRISYGLIPTIGRVPMSSVISPFFSPNLGLSTACGRIEGKKIADPAVGRTGSRAAGGARSPRPANRLSLCPRPSPFSPFIPVISFRGVASPYERPARPTRRLLAVGNI